MIETDWVKDFEAVRFKLLQRGRLTKCECCGAIGRWLASMLARKKLSKGLKPFDRRHEFGSAPEDLVRPPRTVCS